MDISKRDKIRLKLYEAFSKNLSRIKEEDFIHLVPDLEESYICPLCARCFTKNDLDQTKGNCLTLEDIPPKSLGGKPLALTCKECNNQSGSILDEQLRRKLNNDDFFLKIPGSQVEATIRLSPELHTSGTLSHRKDGGLNIHLFKNGLQAKKGKKKCFPRVEENLRSNGIGETNLSIKLHRKNHPEVALLRIAYLLAFSTFGNGFLFNSNLEKVREQIKNPEQELIPCFGVLDIDIPDSTLGIHVIVAPKELRSFLVIFCLNNSNRITKHAVILP